MQTKYVPIQLSTLKANSSFSFDLYICINEKYLLYIRKGDSIEQSRLDRLTEDNDERMFIDEKDLKSYGEFVGKEIDEAVDNPDMSVEKKAEIVEGAAINAVAALETLIEDPSSETAYQMTLKASEGILSVVIGNPEALQVIFKKEGKAHNKILEHSKNVCALVCRFAFLEGLTGKELSDLGAAALLHDIGLTKIKKEEQLILFTKKDEIMTPEDKRIYRLHVRDGVSLLKSKSFVTPEIIKLIEKHHENRSGEGYPNKIKELTKQEEILSLCNHFDKKLIHAGETAFTAIKKIYDVGIGSYSLNILKRFKEVLQEEGLL